MKATFASVLLLLVTATSAHAECAWLMWQEEVWLPGKPGPNVRIGVDPLPWTLFPYGGRSPRCPRADRRTRRSSGSGSSN
jgi:hypothetical protein